MNINITDMTCHLSELKHHIRGIPLITYATRGWGGGPTLMHTNAYKGGGGSEHDYTFCTQVY